MTIPDVEAPIKEIEPPMTGEKAPSDDATLKEEGEEKKPDPLATVGETFSFAMTTKVKVCIALGFLFAAITGCAFPALAWVFADSFERLSGSMVEGNDFMQQIRTIAYQLLILGAVVFVAMTLTATLLETAAGEMTTEMKTQWFQALLRQDMAYYDISDVSGTATIINTNGKKFRRGMGRKLGEGVQFCITFFGGMAFAFYASWKVTLVTLAILPLMVVSTTFLVKMTQSQTSRANSSYAKAGSLVYTAVSSIRTVLALNAVDEFIEKFTKATQESFEGAVSQVIYLGAANGCVMGSFCLVYVPVTLYGGYLLYKEVRETGCDPSGAVFSNTTCEEDAFGIFGSVMGITFAGAVLPQVSGALEAFTGARSACYPALLAISRKTNNQKEQDNDDTHQALIRRGSTAELPPYVIDSSSEDGLKPESINGDIVFDNVTFAYPTRQEVKVYDGFSLDIKAGQTVALCGPSGGGKSTLVQLVERFYDPTSGSITLDGNELSTLNVKWLRQNIGLVSQEPKLFAMSIRDNIKIGVPEATDEEIEAAARKANAHDFIMSFPEGYDTDVGNEGAQLSGGQKQRIAIARILIKKPKIILLDEATSALDSESEVIVQEALDGLMQEGNQTTIVIAHRLSTIRNADLIAVVQGGKVVETGDHSSLLEKEGAYYGLIEAQKGKKDEKSDSDSDSRHSSVSSTNFVIDEDDDKEHLLSFHNVHFHYPSRPDQEIFKGLDLHVEEGETLALVGPSGQGKSTVIQLLENFYRPTEGTIKYKGVDMTTINVKWLRNQIGLVSQEPVLFDTTVEENIKVGVPEATQEQIMDAAKFANAHDFIMSFPDGYETEVGAGSTQISGGQKQRIAIARALIRNPKILLLDEATSALDSESEKVVQEAIDKIMSDKTKTTIVIAHRLSTIRNADRIAVIDQGRVREIGTHDELMALPDGKYKRLQALQDLGKTNKRKSVITESGASLEKSTKTAADEGEMEGDEKEKKKEEMEKAKADASKAKRLSKGDELYFAIGTFGGILAGFMFPGWGIAFAYTIELLYKPVFFCDDDPDSETYTPDLGNCQIYQESVADEMQDLSYDVTYWYVGIIFAAVIGHTLVHYGFGTAVERMNKRVRDSTFKSLVRQEVGYFDVRPVATVTGHLSDDAAMIHSFSGEPIRQLVLNLSSVLVGLVISFVLMWPFAAGVLLIMPFMAFGAEMEMRMYLGEDEGDIEDEKVDEKSAAGIVIESLLNIKTVASLALEPSRIQEFSAALKREDPTPFKSNTIKGGAAGLGQLCQMWGFGAMMWWGGFLIYKYPNAYSFRDFNISMFSLMYGLSGMSVAMQGATDRTKAGEAAARIFALIERKSEIDPLSEEGKKDL